MNPVVHLCIWVCDLEYSFSGVRFSSECIYSKPVISFLRVVDRLEPNSFDFIFISNACIWITLTIWGVRVWFPLFALELHKRLWSRGCDLLCLWLNCIKQRINLDLFPSHLSIYKQERIIRELWVLAIARSEIINTYVTRFTIIIKY